MLLNKFRDQYLDFLLHFLWDEWTVLGVAGQARRPVGHVIDPEALVMFTCTLGRYDQRLFDEVLDWLMVNGRFLSVQRMRNVMRQEGLGDDNVLRAMADWLFQHDSPAKWKLLAANGTPEKTRQSLFFFPDGRPMPKSVKQDPVFLKHGLERNPVVLRGYSRTFDDDALPCFLLKLRALFGVNTRCDVLAYLTMNRSGYPSEIAREMYYSQKAIHETLTELAASGFLHSARTGRERTFRISSSGLVFLGGDQDMKWINWPLLLSVAETVWKKIEGLRAADFGPLVESSEITLALRPLFERLVKSSWAPAMPDFEKIRGVAALYLFLDVFQAVVTKAE